MATQRDAKWTQPVGPRVFKIIEKNMEKSSDFIATYGGGDKYQVKNIYGQRLFIVDLARKTCSCKRWELSGIPCPHSMACMRVTRERPEAYVHSCYKRESYNAAYGSFISPMSDELLWPKTGQKPLEPPIYHAQPGRKKKNRNREVDEPAKGATKLRRYDYVATCTLCHQRGHNKRKCSQVSNITGESSRPNNEVPASTSGNRGGRCKMGIRRGGATTSQPRKNFKRTAKTQSSSQPSQ